MKAIELEDMRERQAYLHQGRGKRDAPGLKFAGVNLTGTLKEWVLAQEQACGRPFRPSKIQEFAMKRIYQGECVVMQAPTGTGKTLAYLLPLLQRLEDETREMSKSQLRLLVLVPTGDLQVQVTAAIRALVGPARSAGVGAIRRDVDGASVGSEVGRDFSVPYAVAVSTPKQISELMEHPTRGHAWRHAVCQIDALVVDEADAFKKHRKMERRNMYLDGEMEPCARLLQNIRNSTERAGRGEQWQLVATSATVNRRVDRCLRFDSGIDLSYIRASGRNGAEVEALPRMGEGESGDGTMWPSGLQHTMRVVPEWSFPTVMKAVHKTVRELDANKTLIVIAGENSVRKNMEIGLNPAVGYLRTRLEDKGFEVGNSATAVKVAAAAFADGGMGERFTPLGRKPTKQVIIALAQAVRGIHLDDVDAVIMVGDPGAPTEYMHVAGRTCRRIPGQAAQEVKAGAVVAVVQDNTANRLMTWSEFLGFKTYEVPLSKDHQSIAQIRGEPGADVADPFEDFDQSEFDVADLYGRPLEPQDNSDGVNSGRGVGNGMGFGDEGWAEDIDGDVNFDEDSDEEEAEQSTGMEKVERFERVPYPSSAGYQSKNGPVKGLRGRPPKPGEVPAHVSERRSGVVGTTARPRRPLDLSDPKFFAEEISKADRDFVEKRKVPGAKRRGRPGAGRPKDGPRAAGAQPAEDGPGAGRPKEPAEAAEEAPTAASGGAWT